MTVGRDDLFDSLKFILMFLVVFGHLIEKLHVSPVMSALYNIIYTFHMPLFIFITGYFSKNITWEKYKQKLPSLLCTYFVFQFILSLPDIINNSFDIIKFIFEPIRIMWYIIGVMIWRLMFCFIPKYNIAPYKVFVGAMCLSITIAFLPFNSIQKYFFFAPYFVLGFYLNNDIIQKIRKIKNIYSYGILIAFCLIVFLFSDNRLWRCVLWGDIYSNFDGDMILAVLSKILAYPMAILISICFINISPVIFNKWGNKTLYIYLLHGIIIYCIIYPLQIDKALFSHYSIINILILTSLSVVIVITCVLLSKLKMIQYIVDPYTHIKQLATNSKK